MKTVRKLFLPALLAVLVWSCSQNPFIGIGNEVDVVPPKLTVTSHKNGNWVFKDFTLSGVVTDNVGVSGGTINLIERNDVTGDEGVSKSWSASIKGDK